MKAFKVRVYPNKQQEKFIRKQVGTGRAIYNKTIAYKKEAYDKYKDDKELLKEKSKVNYPKWYDDMPWMRELDTQGFVQDIRNVHSAYSNFFKSIKGARAGKRVGYPTFKKRGNRGSYSVCGRRALGIDEETKRITVGKLNDNPRSKKRLGTLKYRDTSDRDMSGSVTTVTISFNPAQQFFASLNIEKETQDVEIKKGDKIIGFDMKFENNGGGFVNSEGNYIAFPKPFKDMLGRLRIEQRKLSKMVGNKKGEKKSNHYLTQSKKINIMHNRIKNQREDFLHKLSTELVEEYDVIVLETLNLQGMAKSRFGKNVSELGWNKFITMLEYKGKEKGATIYKVPWNFPSSKTCSKCGYINKDLKLGDRNWKCVCGTELDRDVNAAKNLVNYYKNNQ